MRRTLTTVTVTAGLTISLAACGTSTGSAGGGTTPTASPTAAAQKIAWGACTDLTRRGGDAPATPAATMQCGKLAVPLDYGKPDGETIDLALIRVPATGPGARIGSLVFNFGGPGASGVDTMAQAAKAFGTLGARYDLVSFDPRGVQRSRGVTCGSGAEMDAFTSLNTLPANAETRAKIETATREFALRCQKDSGEVLPYIGTVNAAQDLDRMRVALGDAKLNYFGMSYGTQLGAVYATKFPKNVGRTVLDAPLDPSVTLEERTMAQTTGFQQAYESFLKNCVAEGCELGPDTETANKKIDRLMERSINAPLQVGDRLLTQGLASTAVAAALYSKLSWPFLESALDSALKGDGGALMYLADTYIGRRPDGTYSSEMTSFPAITCVDTAERPDEEELIRTEEAALKISPLFGNAGAGSLCSVWPVPGSDEARKVNATGSGPILVVAGKGDPATPYQWGPRLVEQLKTATLLTYEGEGHGAYLSGSRCVAGAVNAYLLEGKVPDSGATCPA
ncbi:alpha/beta hydrolase [Nonomuraea africana]|uniref:Pimeloyl-ACP methyl ester carboxylesterase n=1 Tax=Nonomuraea africana TaxID=46171 RepID=A0ABR9K7V5_9ACTN|nr:alpha/beta hydrolase [Nonomuraea africana]MBE1558098.1 pimeloyl-ACP methyl ester carboxylesterase [Nonomuraea africana]